MYSITCYNNCTVAMVNKWNARLGKRYRQFNAYTEGKEASPEFIEYNYIENS